MPTTASIAMPDTLPILTAEETELQQFRAAGILLSGGRPGTRHQSDETTRRLAIIAQMRSLYDELRADKRLLTTSNPRCRGAGGVHRAVVSWGRR